jgi:hypothetical protein
MTDLTPPNPPSATVTYDVGQLLDTMRRETAIALERIETKLDSKADKSDLVEMRKDLEYQGERLSRLETADLSRRAATEAREHHGETEREKRARRREYVYSLLMLLLTLGLVLGGIGIHI